MPKHVDVKHQLMIYHVKCDTAGIQHVPAVKKVADLFLKILRVMLKTLMALTGMKRLHSHQDNICFLIEDCQTLYWKREKYATYMMNANMFNWLVSMLLKTSERHVICNAYANKMIFIFGNMTRT